jgi:NAD(P)-dependent dehydrogenase (short-subunit alcohol dehydrogenase family)
MAKPVVLITGALAGIGRATALAFAREGGQLVVSGRHEEAGKEFAKELRGLGAEAEFVRADVRHEEDVRALVEAALERFGRLDVAVNNAGTEGRIGPIVDQTPESYAAVFDTNVLGVLLGLKHELRIMIGQKRGSIVNVSSVAGIRGAPNAAIYVASKHAVEGLTKSAALEAAPFGVLVNSVAPGPVDTGMLDRFSGDASGKADMIASVPLKRAATVEDIAQAILFLASDKASYFTGQALVLDGGAAIAFGGSEAAAAERVKRAA